MARGLVSIEEHLIDIFNGIELVYTTTYAIKIMLHALIYIEYVSINL